jgi:hypothetical protein
MQTSRKTRPKPQRIYNQLLHAKCWDSSLGTNGLELAKNCNPNISTIRNQRSALANCIPINKSVQELIENPKNTIVGIRNKSQQRSVQL